MKQAECSIYCPFHLQIRIKRTTLARYKTYGELYHALCSTTGEIPIALYRTDNQSNVTSTPTPTTTTPAVCYCSKNWNNQNPEREDITDLIRNRMKSLDLSVNDYLILICEKGEERHLLHDPQPVTEEKPSSMFAIPSRLNRTKQKRANMQRSGSDTDLNKPKNKDSAFSRDRTHSLSSQERSTRIVVVVLLLLFSTLDNTLVVVVVVQHPR
ncbi:hypothetical protein DPMN_073568 [Dreissena polymorpha]|uniref:Uncharacterized protein n=1 Tax=Dreissena polymorpha TaxID=45954 RepID=A0A9D4BZ92_DREPO|nr:hypothetical protein DPMN_073568 [Dreissena polymorpha]